MGVYGVGEFGTGASEQVDGMVNGTSLKTQFIAGSRAVAVIQWNEGNKSFP